MNALFAGISSEARVARPRIFVSSTFYNLQQVRADLESFIESLGYEPVLNERGAVPYGHDERLEEYCYKEIDLCDIVLAIIGGRFGSPSQHEPYSISQMELKTAVELGKPLYIFVEQPVLHEFRTYRRNKHNDKIVYDAVDSRRVYEFLDEIEALPKNNAMAPFSSVQDITAYLREQWAGLFQRFLQERQRINEVNAIKDMRATADTLNRLVNFLIEEKREGDEAIKSILAPNHPVFSRLAKMTSTPYRVFFTTKEEMEKWLEARNWIKDGNRFDIEDEEYVRDGNRSISRITINTQELFDEGRQLKVISPENWNDAWLSFASEEKRDDLDDLDDEIPF